MSLKRLRRRSETIGRKGREDSCDFIGFRLMTRCLCAFNCRGWVRDRIDGWPNGHGERSEASQRLTKGKVETCASLRMTGTDNSCHTPPVNGRGAGGEALVIPQA